MLVPEQKDALTKVLNCVKGKVKYRCNPTLSKPEQLLLIMQGGAGVGKSKTINAMAQWAERILLKQGHHEDKPRVLLCAFTGKAASLIGGITVHSGFGIQNNSNGHVALGAKTRAEMEYNLSELELIIIDEISLIGADMFFQIHMRLCEIKHRDPTKCLFGGISMVCVGDLLQIQPVMQEYIFLQVVFWGT